MPTFQFRPLRHPWRLSLGAAAILSASGLWASGVLAAGPIPQGGQFVAGQGTIGANGAALNIVQTTPRGVINWDSFSIDAGRAVNINNGTGATLNRVTGLERSDINGALNATGSVYLINPQGVVIGASGIVTTGGRFVASSLDLSNDAFMNGGAMTLSGTGDGVVVNLGSISSSGGDVFLISRNLVENDGTIAAPQGTAEMAVGSQVLLRDATSGPQVFVQTGSAGMVFNRGTVSAAQIDLAAADGNVFALGGRNSALRATGTATRDGHVWLVAETGTVHAHGDIQAVNADASGGTLDMNAATFHFDNVQIDAAQWNLTTPHYTIGPLAAEVLQRTLANGTSITVNANGHGLAGTDTSGDVEVLSSLNWTGNAALVFNASHSVSVAPAATIANTGAAGLTLRADAEAVNNGGSVVNQGTLDWSASRGVIAALYDMNGSYAPGTIKTNASWSAAAFSGLKTQATAYQLVNSMTDVAAISNDLTGSYALGRDIDGGQASTRFVPIGQAANTPFTGEFDGMGHVIDSLFIYEGGPASVWAGLFSVIGESGVVRNLGMTNSVASSMFSPLGLIAGLNRGLITNSYTDGGYLNSQATPSVGAGGLVAQNDGTIARSWSNANVGAQGELGGLAAYNNGTIIQSYATNSVQGGEHSTAGGLVGVNAGRIVQSYATGFVGAVDSGGLVDQNTGTIQESFSTAAITTDIGPGLKSGLANSNSGTIAGNVFWDKETSGQTTGVGVGTAIPAANGLTTAQMSTAASFGPTWDFTPTTGTWAIPTGGTHPVLQWQLEH